jgi:Flp pilus assembly protein TadG
VAECARERGSVSAEFAAVIPATILVLAFCLSGIRIATDQLRIEQAASSAARLIARGEGEAHALSLVKRTVSGATLTSRTTDGLLCATVSLQPTTLVDSWLGLTLSASSCALAGG